MSGKEDPSMWASAFGTWPMISASMTSSVSVLILSVFSYFFAFALKDEISPKAMVFSHGFVMGAFWLYHMITGVRWWMWRYSDVPGEASYLDMARSRFVTFVFWHYIIFLVWGIIWLENYNGSNGFGSPQPAPGTGAFQFWQAFQALYSLFAMFYAALGFNYAVALASSTPPNTSPGADGGYKPSSNGNASTARKVHVALLAFQNFIAFGSSFWMFFIHNGIKAGMPFDGFFWLHVIIGAFWLAGLGVSLWESRNDGIDKQVFWKFMETRRPTIFFTMWYFWAFIFYVTAVDTSDFGTGSHQDFNPAPVPGPQQSDFYIVLQMFYVCNGILVSYFGYNWITATVVFLNITGKDYYSLLLNPSNLTDIANAHSNLYKEGPRYMWYAYRTIVLLTYTYFVIHVMWMFTELAENHDVNHYFFDWGVSFAAIGGFFWFLITVFTVARWIDQDNSGAGGPITATISFRTIFPLMIVIFQGAFGYLWLNSKYSNDGAIATSVIKDPAEKEYYMWTNNTTFQFGAYFVVIMYLGELYFLASLTEWKSLAPVAPGNLVSQGGNFLRNAAAQAWGTARGATGAAAGTAAGVTGWTLDAAGNVVDASGRVVVSAVDTSLNATGDVLDSSGRVVVAAANVPANVVRGSYVAGEMRQRQPGSTLLL